MRDYVYGWKKYILGASIFRVFYSGLFVVAGYLIGLVTDSALLGDISRFGTLVIYLVATHVIAFLFGTISTHFELRGSVGIMASTTSGLFGKLYAGTLNRFRKRDDAYYINLAVNDSSTLFSERYGSIPAEAGFAVQGLVALGLLLSISPWMFGISIAFLLLPIVTMNIFMKIIRKRKLLASETAERYTASVTEAIQGYESIKLIGIPQGYFNRFGSIMGNMYTALKNDIFMQTQASRVGYLLTAVLDISALSLGAFLIVRGQISAGELLAATFMFCHVSDGIRNYFYARTRRLGTNPIKDKFENELSASEEIGTTNGTDISFECAVEYKHVSFRFDNSQNLYTDFSFIFEPGHTYAILGESGSGKSTLLKLLLKYYNEYEGQISIGGRDIRQIPESEVYKLIGVVNQSPFLLNDTLKNNITMFDDSVPDITPMLTKLSLNPLSERVGEMLLGDFGESISGGERQRISIARTLIKKPKIIIFDEPTTGLDPENTKLINDFIFSLDGITRIVITHDWSSEYLGRFDSVVRLGA